jgi:hypothetical protein
MAGLVAFEFLKKCRQTRSRCSVDIFANPQNDPPMSFYLCYRMQRHCCHCDSRCYTAFDIAATPKRGRIRLVTIDAAVDVPSYPSLVLPLNHFLLFPSQLFHFHAPPQNMAGHLYGCSWPQETVERSPSSPGTLHENVTALYSLELVVSRIFRGKAGKIGGRTCHEISRVCEADCFSLSISEPLFNLTQSGKKRDRGLRKFQADVKM